MLVLASKNSWTVMVTRNMCSFVFYIFDVTRVIIIICFVVEITLHKTTSCYTFHGNFCQHSYMLCCWDDHTSNLFLLYHCCQVYNYLWFIVDALFFSRPEIISVFKKNVEKFFACWINILSISCVYLIDSFFHFILFISIEHHMYLYFLLLHWHSRALNEVRNHV